MTYEDWEVGVPQEIKIDSVWRVKAYRLGLFLSDLAWLDVTSLLQDLQTRAVAEQLNCSTAKISASIAEGHSRDTGKARATYYEYALGSARESRDWYYKGRRVLKSEVVKHRIELCAEIARLTLKMVANERRTNRRASGCE